MSASLGARSSSFRLSFIFRFVTSWAVHRDRFWCYNLKQTDRSAVLPVKLLSWIIINYHKSFNKQNRARRHWFTTDLWKSPTKSVHRPYTERLWFIELELKETYIFLVRVPGGGMDTNDKCDYLTKDRCASMLRSFRNVISRNSHV